jgi:hypothetical protein
MYKNKIKGTLNKVAMYEIFVNLSCINRTTALRTQKLSPSRFGFDIIHRIELVRVYLILSKLVHGINIGHISDKDLNYYSYIH